MRVTSLAIEAPPHVHSKQLQDTFVGRTDDLQILPEHIYSCDQQRPVTLPHCHTYPPQRSDPYVCSIWGSRDVRVHNGAANLQYLLTERCMGLRTQVHTNSGDI